MEGRGRQLHPFPHRRQGLDGRYLHAIEPCREIVQNYDTLVQSGRWLILSLHEGLWKETLTPALRPSDMMQSRLQRA